MRKRRKQDPSCLNRLALCPREIQSEILRYCDLEFALRVLMRVSHHFSDCLRSGRTTWVAKVPRRWTSNPRILKLVAKKIPRFVPQNLYLEARKMLKEMVFAFVSLSGVTHLALRLSNTNWSSADLQLLCTSCPLLEALDFDGVFWNEPATVWEWARACKKLKNLRSIHLHFRDTRYLSRPGVGNYETSRQWSLCFSDLPVTKVTTADVGPRMWILLLLLPLTSLDVCKIKNSEQHVKVSIRKKLRALNLSKLALTDEIPALFSPSLKSLKLCPEESPGDSTLSWKVLYRHSPCLTHLTLSDLNLVDLDFPLAQFSSLTSLELLKIGKGEREQMLNMTYLRWFSNLRLTRLSLWFNPRMPKVPQLWTYLFETWPLVCLKIKGGACNYNWLEQDLDELRKHQSHGSRLTLQRLHLGESERGGIPEKVFTLLHICFPKLVSIRLRKQPAFDLPFANIEERV